MTSGRACYCKREGCVVDKDAGARSESRRPASAASRRSIVRSGNGEGSRRTRRSVADERKPDTGGSIEAQARDPVLSPETSTALENAERIISDAKIQLAEVRAASQFDSARLDKDTCAESPPLDDEVEELLYIRELVASKFQEASYPGRVEASSEENVRRVAARRVDLSAPKFRTSQWRRVAARTFLDEQRSHGERAPLASVSKDSKDSSPKDSSSRDDDATTRGSRTARDRRRISSARYGLVHPDDGNVCRIQVGPPVHVDGELTRQDLEDVHISPEPLPARKCANAAVYILRHESSLEDSREDQEATESPTATRAQRRVFARLTSPREKRGKLTVTDAAMNTTSASRKLDEVTRVVLENEAADYEQKNEQTKLAASEVRDGIHEEEWGNERIDFDAGADVEEARIPGRSLKSVTDAVTSERSDPAGVIQVETSSANNMGRLRTVDEGVFNKEIGVAGPGRRVNEEHVADKIPAKNRGDQSNPPLDVLRRANFPRRENIAQPRRTAGSPRQYRTIDEYLTDTFNGHDGPTDEPRDVVAGELRRSRLSSDDFLAKDDVNEVELYRPRLDELDSILLSNDKKIERVVRVTRNFAQLLSQRKFAEYKSKEEKHEWQHFGPGEPPAASAWAKPMTTASSSVVNATPENPSALIASEIPRASEVGSRETSAATETKSSGFAMRDPHSCDDRSNFNSIESTERPTSGVSDGSKVSANEDEAQQPTAKACFSELSMDKSDITTFFNLPPAMSSTHTDMHPYQSRQKQTGVAQAEHRAVDDPYGDSRSTQGVTNRFEDLASKIASGRTSERRNVDDALAQVLRSLKDETTDRFVAYLLQDEKHSIEGKIAKALNESVVAPTMIEKLLARLQEIDSIGDGATRRTETLDVLTNILVNVKKRTDEVVDDEVAKIDKNIDDANSSILTPREENERQARTRVALNKNGRLLESRASKNLDEHSARPSVPESPETRAIVRSATYIVPSSRGNSENKRDSRSESESLKKVSDIPDDETENLKDNSRLSSAKTMSVRSRYDHEKEGNDPNAATATLQDKEGNITNQAADTLFNVPDEILAGVKDKEEKKEIATEELANDHTSLKDRAVSPRTSDISGKQDVPVQSNANSSGLKVADKILVKKDLASTENMTRSSRSPTQKNINKPRANSAATTNGKISPANSCSADSLRDCASLRTLSSAQSDESPLKEIRPRGKRTSFDIVGQDNLMRVNKASNDVRGGPTTSEPAENQNGNEDLTRNARSDGNERFRPVVASTSRKSLSSLSSSTTTLGHVGGLNDDVFADDIKRAMTSSSSEVSHSEGELYMPSSCSYSLGEVRILEKGELIANSTIEHDSSVTVLVTKSMLTSLNHSSTVLGSSGCI